LWGGENFPGGGGLSRGAWKPGKELLCDFYRKAGTKKNNHNGEEKRGKDWECQSEKLGGPYAKKVPRGEQKFSTEECKFTKQKAPKGGN